MSHLDRFSASLESKWVGETDYVAPEAIGVRTRWDWMDLRIGVIYII